MHVNASLDTYIDSHSHIHTWRADVLQPAYIRRKKKENKQKKGHREMLSRGRDQVPIMSSARKGPIQGMTAFAMMGLWRAARAFDALAVLFFSLFLFFLMMLRLYTAVRYSTQLQDTSSGSRLSYIDHPAGYQSGNERAGRQSSRVSPRPVAYTLFGSRTKTASLTFRAQDVVFFFFLLLPLPLEILFFFQSLVGV